MIAMRQQLANVQLSAVHLQEAVAETAARGVQAKDELTMAKMHHLSALNALAEKRTLPNSNSKSR